MKRAGAILLGLITLVSLAWVATPMILIRPFGAQTPEGIAVAYAMRGRAAPLTLGLLILGIPAALFLRPRLGTRRGRLLTGAAVVLLASGALLSRQNHFEWMFRPLPEPGFVAVGDAGDVAEDDLVLGVVIASETRAYPVRALAYHHVVNDVVAGEPIVATY